MSELSIAESIRQDYEEEIERQKEIIKQLDIKNLELTTIIKEVREYIESYMPNYDFDKTNLIKLLGILDKVEEDNNEDN